MAEPQADSATSLRASADHEPPPQVRASIAGRAACLVTTHGAVWLESVVGMGRTDSGSLAALTSDGSRHPLVSRSVPHELVPRLLHLLAEINRCAVRDEIPGRIYVVSLDADLVVRVTIRHIDTWQLLSEQRYHTVAAALGPSSEPAPPWRSASPLPPPAGPRPIS